MTAKYFGLVTKLREERNLSQTAVAKAVGMSRSSYIAFEKGEKEPSFTQASKLAGLFGVTVDELMNGQLPDYKKYTQMIFAFLGEAKQSNTDIKKTKLAKLLYLADFAKYYFYNESMSGMAYRKIEYGPVPDAYFRVLEKLEEDAEINVTMKTYDGKNMFIISQTRVSEKKELDLLSMEEKELIHKVWGKWKFASTQEIVQYTHDQIPYTKTEYDQIIPYELIKEEKAEYVY